MSAEIVYGHRIQDGIFHSRAVVQAKSELTEELEDALINDTALWDKYCNGQEGLIFSFLYSDICERLEGIADSINDGMETSEARAEIINLMSDIYAKR